MSKVAIKIIKRNDAKAIADAKTRNAAALKQISTVSEKKSESRRRRELIKEVSGWIPEREKNNRVKEVAAIRCLFDDDSLLEET